MAAGNKGRGEFNLEGIRRHRAARRDRSHLRHRRQRHLHVGAKHKATGSENKITIKANSGLTEEEIQKMVRDAEGMPRTTNAEGAAEACNQAMRWCIRPRNRWLNTVTS